jgi:uncharacterized protein (TIGR02466 family)
MSEYLKKIMQLFPTTVMLVDLTGHPCKEKLLEIIDETETKDHYLLTKGKSSFEGNGGILFHPDLEHLRFDIQDSIKKYSTMLGTFPIQLANNWFNVMEPGGAVNPHRHEGSIISGAYYVRAPEGSASLHFSSPLKPLRMNEVTQHANDYNEGEHDIPCMEDLLVLFPSWLEHYTNENPNDSRTVVSFNTDYSKRNQGI